MNKKSKTKITSVKQGLALAKASLKKTKVAPEPEPFPIAIPAGFRRVKADEPVEFGDRWAWIDHATGSVRWELFPVGNKGQTFTLLVIRAAEVPDWAIGVGTVRFRPAGSSSFYTYRIPEGYALINKTKTKLQPGDMSGLENHDVEASNWRPSQRAEIGGADFSSAHVYIRKLT